MIETRLKRMEDMKQGHEQDLIEFDAVIDVLKKQISKLPKKEEKKTEKPTGAQ